MSAGRNTDPRLDNDNFQQIIKTIKDFALSDKKEDIEKVNIALRSVISFFERNPVTITFSQTESIYNAVTKTLLTKYCGQNFGLCILYSGERLLKIHGWDSHQAKSIHRDLAMLYMGTQQWDDVNKKWQNFKKNPNTKWADDFDPLLPCLKELIQHNQFKLATEIYQDAINTYVTNDSRIADWHKEILTNLIKSNRTTEVQTILESKEQPPTTTSAYYTVETSKKHSLAAHITTTAWYKELLFECIDNKSPCAFQLFNKALSFKDKINPDTAVWCRELILHSLERGNFEFAQSAFFALIDVNSKNATDFLNTLWQLAMKQDRSFPNSETNTYLNLINRFYLDYAVGKNNPSLVNAAPVKLQKYFHLLAWQQANGNQNFWKFPDNALHRKFTNTIFPLIRLIQPLTAAPFFQSIDRLVLQRAAEPYPPLEIKEAKNSDIPAKEVKESKRETYRHVPEPKPLNLFSNPLKLEIVYQALIAQDADYAEIPGKFVQLALESMMRCAIPKKNDAIANKAVHAFHEHQGTGRDAAQIEIQMLRKILDDKKLHPSERALTHCMRWLTTFKKEEVAAGVKTCLIDLESNITQIVNEAEKQFREKQGAGLFLGKTKQLLRMHISTIITSSEIPSDGFKYKETIDECTTALAQLFAKKLELHMPKHQEGADIVAAPVYCKEQHYNLNITLQELRDTLEPVLKKNRFITRAGLS